MLMAPILMVAVIVLGRYMRSGQRGAGGRPRAQPGLVMRHAAGSLWLLPVRLVLRAVRAIFWAGQRGGRAPLGGLFGATMRLPSAGGDAGRERAPRRRAGGAAGGRRPSLVITFVELYPFYWIVITAFKTNLQIQQFTLRLLARPLDAGALPLLFLESSFLDLAPQHRHRRRGRHRDRRSACRRWAPTRWCACAGGGPASSPPPILITYLMPGIMLVVPLYQVFAELHAGEHALASLMRGLPHLPDAVRLLAADGLLPLASRRSWRRRP